MWRCGRAVRQRSAKPRTRVRVPATPPKNIGRVSYNGYYTSLPWMRYGFNSRYPLQNKSPSLLGLLFWHRIWELKAGGRVARGGVDEFVSRQISVTNSRYPLQKKIPICWNLFLKVIVWGLKTGCCCGITKKPKNFFGWV